jgi:ABC-type nitrate/sulfonate/bicarbonate transport system ATPase subunit
VSAAPEAAPMEASAGAELPGAGMARTPGVRLEAISLAKTFAGGDGGEVRALEDISIRAAPGEFVAVIGPSGCGKSTLFHILAGLEDPDRGEVLIDGTRIEQRLGACAFMPQRDGLLPWRRTIDNVTIGLSLAGMPRAEAHARARPLLERFGLGGFERAWPWQLSGGMRHRAAFLRTVLLGRPAMLLDEPFGALDGITRSDLQRWLLGVWQEVGSTVVLITHDVAEAVHLADRVYVLSPRPGRVAATLRIDLPRPRTPEMLVSSEFAVQEALLREALREHSGARPRPSNRIGLGG